MGPSASFCYACSFAAYLVSHPMAPSFYDDDTAYETLAYWYLHRSFALSSYYPYSIRILQIIPIAVSYCLFGQNMLSNAMWDILSSLLLVLIAFYIGKLLYNKYVGYISSLFVPPSALSPYYTVLLPLFFSNVAQAQARKSCARRGPR